MASQRLNCHSQWTQAIPLLQVKTLCSVERSIELSHSNLTTTWRISRPLNPPLVNISLRNTLQTTRYLSITWQVIRLGELLLKVLSLMLAKSQLSLANLKEASLRELRRK